MSPLDSVMRIVTSLPFLLFIVVSILNAVLRGSRKGSYVQSTTAVRPEVQDSRIRRKSEIKKERRGMDTDSELVAQAYYVDANEQDWSFEADNKPRKTPIGFDR